MIHKHIQYYSKHFKEDAPASLVVFLVALPLCLGIALASGAPLFSGLIAGLVGGLLVAWLSGSQLAVTGPAAGLTVIVFSAIETLGSFQGLLVAVVLAGIFQIILGYLRAGIIGAFFPSAVIEGMLAAIGLILIIKQVPHAAGYDTSYEGDESYMQETAESSFLELLDAFNAISLGSVVISSVALVILILWVFLKSHPILKFIPAPLIAVIWGVGFNEWAMSVAPEWAVHTKHLVSLPITNSPKEFFDNFIFPDFQYLTNPQTYIVAATIAIIASLETLLSLDATDKLDPLKRISPTNRELKAQGVGNIVSGLLGGLPMTAVIVRSAANINAGGRSSMSCFLHGIWLLLSLMFLTTCLNMIPLACLSAILLHTGYKLANPAVFKRFYKKGMSQFLPFLITIIAILVTDLLKGIVIGLVIGLFFVIKANYQAAITLSKDNLNYLLSFNKDVSFLNKALLRKFILQIPANSTVIIDASKTTFVDYDILEVIEEFLDSATEDNITVELVNVYGKKKFERYTRI
ncbi:MAG: SulP family inorganic anion transporter [Methylococcaceae bacterium]|nr:SulP family inorganic anion transporter [Methylococcaceae bacterium]